MGGAEVDGGRSRGVGEEEGGVGGAEEGVGGEGQGWEGQRWRVGGQREEWERQRGRGGRGRVGGVGRTEGEGLERQR